MGKELGFEKKTSGWPLTSDAFHVTNVSVYSVEWEVITKLFGYSNSAIYTTILDLFFSLIFFFFLKNHGLHNGAVISFAMQFWLSI